MPLDEFTGVGNRWQTLAIRRRLLTDLRPCRAADDLILNLELEEQHADLPQRRRS